MDFSQFKFLSFDCYGTLIDWKKSVLQIIKPVIHSYNLEVSEEELFDLFLEADSKLIVSEYRPYRDILTGIMDELAGRLNMNLQPADRSCLVDRFGDWIPFPDTIESMIELQKRYKLAIISNVDDEMFYMTRRCIGIQFEHIITAKQVGSYKPSKNNFIRTLGILGIESNQVLHVAQSIYHDIVPTNELGWSNVWVNRYNEPERTDPVEFPDLEVPDLKSLVKIINLEWK